MDSRTFTIASICAGVGGLDLGVQLALPKARTVVYVEREAACCDTLATRMEEGWLDSAPLWTDVLTFDGRPWRGLVDGLIGGYPCQPFSTAGKQSGRVDARYIWPAICEMVRTLEVPFCFFENVGQHLRVGYAHVHRDLQRLGYTIAAGLFTAEEVGAPHKRERLFILAHAKKFAQRESGHEGLWTKGREGTERSELLKAMANTNVAQSGRDREHRRAKHTRRVHSEVANRSRTKRWTDHKESKSRSTFNWLSQPSKALGHAHESRSQGRPLRDGERPRQFPAWPPMPDDSGAWRSVLQYDASVEPALRGVVDGMAARVDRLRACGNGVIPLQAAYAFTTLANALATTGKL